MLEAKQFTFKYKNSSKGIENISFSIQENEVFGFLGPSGSGKSTLVKAIMNLPGLTSDATISGELNFKGKNLFHLSSQEKRQLWKTEIGVVFQESLSSLNPLMRIKKQLYEVNREENFELLQTLNFKDPERILNSYPHELSGGMCQRIMLAMALSKKPKLLILDEPTTALDPTIQKEILDLLQEIKNKTKLSILLVSHDLRVLAKLADQIGVIHEGKLIETQNTASFFKSPEHPFSVRLIHAYRQLRSPLF